MSIQKAPSQPGCNGIERCIEACDGRSVFVEENGVRATFANPSRRRIRKIHYDGCFNKNSKELKADYILGLRDVLDVIVELKGSDLKHARDQVEVTLDRWRTNPFRFQRIVCLIVYGRLEGKQRKAGRIPCMSSTIQSLERAFLRTNRTLLRICESSSVQFIFDDSLRKTDASR
jgi:hypothetical protein